MAAESVRTAAIAVVIGAAEVDAAAVVVVEDADAVTGAGAVVDATAVAMVDTAAAAGIKTREPILSPQEWGNRIQKRTELREIAALFCF